MLAAHVVGGRQEVPDGRTADDEATVADAHPEGQVGRAPRHHLDVEAAVGKVVHVVGEPRPESGLGLGIEGCGHRPWNWGSRFSRKARTPSLWSSVAKSSPRSEEHTSELQSLMRISYAVFCLKKKNN